MPAVSVIIPVYNTAPFLNACLGSLVKQTLRDIEIICVDDGSTDNSLALLREYAARDPRVRVIASGMHRGAAVARNTGLAAARGEYAGFVDSDDSVDANYYEILYTTAVDTGADIVKASYYKEADAERLAQEEYNAKIDTAKHIFSINFTTAIYRRCLIEDNAITFPEGLTNYEDVVFLIQAVYYANAVTTVRDTYYHYRIHEHSAVRGKNHSVITRNVMAACGKILHFIDTVDISEQYYNYIFYQIIQNLIYCTSKLRELPEDITLAAINLVRAHKYLRRSSQNSPFIPQMRRSPLAMWRRILHFSGEFSTQQEDKAFAVARCYQVCTSMTVCLLIASLAAGGAERQLVTLARGLAHAGVNVYVFSQNQDGAFGYYRPLLQEAGIPVFRIEDAETSKEFLAIGAAAAKKDPSLAHRVRSLPLPYLKTLCLAGFLAKLSPDVLHCYIDETNCMGGCAGALAGVPGIVLSARGADPPTAGYDNAAKTQPVYAFLLSRPDVYMEANSRAGAAGYANWLEHPLESIAVTPNGIERTRFLAPPEARQAVRAALGLGAEAPVVLCLARFHPDKRPEDMLAVCAALRDRVSGVRLLVAGGGMGETEEMGAMVNDRGLAGCVRLLGVRDDVAGLLAAADILLHTSKNEGFPNAILEAMSAGLPVVATCVGGVPDLVRQGKDAFLHPVGDIEGMAASLARLFDDTALRKRMGENARERVRDNFTVEKLVERTLGNYSALLSRVPHTDLEWGETHGRH